MRKRVPLFCIFFTVFGSVENEMEWYWSDAVISVSFFIWPKLKENKQYIYSAVTDTAGSGKLLLACSCSFPCLTRSVLHRSHWLECRTNLFIQINIWFITLLISHKWLLLNGQMNTHKIEMPNNHKTLLDSVSFYAMTPNIWWWIGLW